MEFRKVEDRDLEECSNLLENAYSDEPYNEKFNEGDALEYIMGKFNDCKGYSFVATEAGKVIGFVFANLSHWAGGPQAIMEEIVVDKNYRGKGVSQKINEALEEHFRSLNISSGMLWVKKDSPAHKFHLKNNYFNADDIVVMFKDF